jgi:hypothetical protein
LPALQEFQKITVPKNCDVGGVISFTGKKMYIYLLIMIFRLSDFWAPASDRIYSFWNSQILEMGGKKFVTTYDLALNVKFFVR